MIEQPTGREVRTAVEAWPSADLEIRTEGDGMTFAGYAAVFNSLSEDLGGFRERIQPGAFSRTLKADRDIRMFLNHNTDSLLATTKAGTLRLAEDGKGLRVEADLPDTSTGRDLSALMRRGDVNSMSFGFQVPEKGSNGQPAQTWDGAERTLHEIKLFEVSPITGWPAYPATSASVRHLAEGIHVDADELDAAARALFSPEKLTPEQRDLLVRAINARTDVPLIATELAEWRARFAAKGLTA